MRRKMKIKEGKRERVKTKIKNDGRTKNGS
jgi:hypothetical protein